MIKIAVPLKKLDGKLNNGSSSRCGYRQPAEELLTPSSLVWYGGSVLVAYHHTSLSITPRKRRGAKIGKKCTLCSSGGTL
jgi:hypothetical protein